jgi:hypothetical protein
MAREARVIGSPKDRIGVMAVLTLIWATLEQDRMKWRGVQMDEELRGRIIQADKEMISEKFALSVLDTYLEAA